MTVLRIDAYFTLAGEPDGLPNALRELADFLERDTEVARPECGNPVVSHGSHVANVQNWGRRLTGEAGLFTLHGYEWKKEENKIGAGAKLEGHFVVK